MEIAFVFECKFAVKLDCEMNTTIADGTSAWSQIKLLYLVVSGMIVRLLNAQQYLRKLKILLAKSSHKSPLDESILISIILAKKITLFRVYGKRGVETRRPAYWLQKILQKCL